MSAGHGAVFMTDRYELAIKGEDYPGEVAWRGIIFDGQGKQLWRGRAQWTRSAAYTDMEGANKWGARLETPLPDEAPI